MSALLFIVFKVRPCEELVSLVQFPWTGSWTWGFRPFAPQRGDLLGHDILHFWVTARGLGVWDLKRPQVQAQSLFTGNTFYFSWVNI